MLRPAAHDTGVIAAETLALIDALAKLGQELPGAHTLPPEVTRAARREGEGYFPFAGPLPEGRWHQWDSDSPHPGQLRIVEPHGKPQGVFLHIHGGGWVFGAPDEFDAHHLKRARDSGLLVASVRYRLAPEHPWPAAVDDCAAALRYVLREAKNLWGADRIVIGGRLGRRPSRGLDLAAGARRGACLAGSGRGSDLRLLRFAGNAVDAELGSGPADSLSADGGVVCAKLRTCAAAA